MNEVTTAPAATDKGLYPAIMKAQSSFLKAAKYTGIDWERESIYAWQIISQSEYLMKVALGNPASVTNALINVASIGLTLNPALKYCHLVPRMGRIGLEISYFGLMQLAKQSGAIKQAQVVLIYENDTFEAGPPSQLPVHKYNPMLPMEKRGAIIGGYCYAQGPDGEQYIEYMNMEEIGACERLSKSNDSPWKGPFRSEMVKKTILKRAAKWWTAKSVRFANAMAFVNEESDGINFGIHVPEEGKVIDGVQATRLLTDADLTEEEISLMDKVLLRATESGQWSAARDYVQAQFSPPVAQWALNKLSEAEARITVPAE